MSSEHDQCLFLHKEKKISLLLCIDDCSLFCEDNEELTRTIKAMQEKFALSEQDIGKDVFGYPGIELTMKGINWCMCVKMD